MKEDENGWTLHCTDMEVADLITTLKLLEGEGFIEHKKPPKWAICQYIGREPHVSRKWNVTIYESGKAVTNDMHTLQKMMIGETSGFNIIPSKEIIQIDDAGIGFPFGGVMLGICYGKHIETRIIEYGRELWNEYAQAGLGIILYKYPAEDYQVQICTGYVNRKLKDALRKNGYHVMVSEIKGHLQDNLELLYKMYINDTFHYKRYLDPKEAKDATTIATLYYDAVRYAKEHGIPLKWKE